MRIESFKKWRDPFIPKSNQRNMIFKKVYEGARLPSIPLTSNTSHMGPIYQPIFNQSDGSHSFPHSRIIKSLEPPPPPLQAGEEDIRRVSPVGKTPPRIIRSPNFLGKSSVSILVFSVLSSSGHDSCSRLLGTNFSFAWRDWTCISRDLRCCSSS